MKLVTDLSLTGRPVPSGTPFSPAHLFSQGRTGLWLDASDQSALFQDAEGTQPVQAFGQPVGRILDRSGNGHDAWQSVAGRRPVYARHPASGPRNLLLHSNRFDQAPWSSIFTRTANAGPAPDGSMTATLVETTGAGQLIQPFVATTTTSYTFSIYVKAGNAGVATAGFVLRNLTTATNCAFATLTWATMSLTLSTGIAHITPVGDGWYRLVMTAPSGFAPGDMMAAYAGSAISAGLSYWLWGAQVEQGAAASALQTVTSAADMTEPGQTDVPHLLFDGIDDNLETDPVDLSASTSLAVIAAARTNATGFLVECSPDSVVTDGGFALVRGGFAPHDLTFVARTQTERERLSTPPIAQGDRALAFVASAVADPMASPRMALRSDLGTGQIEAGQLRQGSFATHKLWIGARAGGTGPLGGRLYGLMVLGKAPAPAVRQMAERYYRNFIEGMPA